MKQVCHIALATLCLAGMWLHVNRVVIAHQVSESHRLGTPRGNLSDLYPRWLGARELLLHHLDPYSREVTQEIQAGYYGRTLDPSRPNDPTDQQAFAYPLYTVFLLAPTVTLPFSSVRPVFFWVLAGLTVLSVVLWLRFLKWRPGWSAVAGITLLTLGSFAAVQGLKLQQLTLVVAFVLAASLACLSAEQYVGAGILLALATIKPQLTVLLAAWLMLWSLSDLRRRWRFIAAFLVSLGALVGGAELLLPGWIPKFYAALVAYRHYAPAGPLLEQMLPRAIAIAVILSLGISLAVVCWTERNYGPYDFQFVTTTSLVLAVTLLLIPMTPPYNQVLLLPGILLLVRDWRELWTRSIAGRAILALAAIPLVWSWASATVIAAASFFTPTAQRFWQVPLWTSVVLPIPVVACLGLLTFNKIFNQTTRSRPVHEANQGN